MTDRRGMGDTGSVGGTGGTDRSPRPLSRPASGVWPRWRGNGDIFKPWTNGIDLTWRPSGSWISDFGPSRMESDAALYEAPFAHVAVHVRRQRQGNRGAA